MRYPKIKIVKNKGAKTPGSKWKAEGLRDPSGKRTRKFFRTKEDGEEWLRENRAQLTNQGRSALSLSDRDRIDAQRALEVLKPYGVTLLEAANSYSERADALSRSVSFTTLIEEVLSAKKADGKSSAYLTALKGYLNRFCEDFGDRLVAEYTSQEIDDWLRKLPHSPTTRNNYRRNLSVAFSFAISRQYCAKNPVTNTAEAKVVLDDPGILTPIEFEALLTMAPSDMLASLAIGGFAGVREAEIQRLDWSDIDRTDQTIKIKAAKAKTASRRTVTIHPTLSVWLSLYPPTKAGPIHPPKYHHKLKRLRKDAAQALKAAGKAAPNLEVWPSNALRHSAISYRLVTDQNAGLIALDAGHTQAILHRNYKSLVRRQDGERWFGILPEQSDQKVVNFIVSESKV